MLILGIWFIGFLATFLGLWYARGYVDLHSVLTSVFWFITIPVFLWNNL